jgi:hypothetical protein
MAVEQPSIELFFRTDDMAMVTYLKLQGHQVQKNEWVGIVATGSLTVAICSSPW